MFIWHPAASLVRAYDVSAPISTILYYYVEVLRAGQQKPNE